MIKCTGGRHVRTVQKDGTWPSKCQCGKHDYSKRETKPPLRIHITDGVGSEDRVGG